MIDELNKEAFELINLVVSKPKSPLLATFRTELRSRNFNYLRADFGSQPVQKRTVVDGKTGIDSFTPWTH